MNALLMLTAKVAEAVATMTANVTKDYKHTMVLTANDLKEGFNKFATISYDNETQQYVTMPTY